MIGVTYLWTAMDMAWLAYNLRKPILGILQVDPTDFQELATLEGKLWEELHAFFERGMESGMLLTLEPSVSLLWIGLCCLRLLI